MIEIVVYQTLVKNKKIKIFMLIISEINKALQVSSVEDFAKLNEMTSVVLLNELKKKFSIIYHEIDNEIYLFMMSTTNLLILFCI